MTTINSCAVGTANLFIAGQRKQFTSKIHTINISELVPVPITDITTDNFPQDAGIRVDVEDWYKEEWDIGSTFEYPADADLQALETSTFGTAGPWAAICQINSTGYFLSRGALNSNIEIYKVDLTTGLLVEKLTIPVTYTPVYVKKNLYMTVDYSNSYILIGTLLYSTSTDTWPKTAIYKIDVATFSFVESTLLDLNITESTPFVEGYAAYSDGVYTSTSISANDVISTHILPIFVADSTYLYIAVRDMVSYISFVATYSYKILKLALSNITSAPTEILTLVDETSDPITTGTITDQFKTWTSSLLLKMPIFHQTGLFINDGYLYVGSDRKTQSGIRPIVFRLNLTSYTYDFLDISEATTSIYGGGVSSLTYNAAYNYIYAANCGKDRGDTVTETTAERTIGDGWIARIDPTTFIVEQKLALPESLEQIPMDGIVVNDTLYIITRMNPFTPTGDTSWYKLYVIPLIAGVMQTPVLHGMEFWATSSGKTNYPELVYKMLYNCFELQTRPTETSIFINT